ncbi:pentatricopeptide repeat-containing protein DOT4, chloroplastic-like [Cucurbita pepo subsp. pepo]|uniref:pentatricopeptide repeat-containing protein DOT4, chloroplastic-like n=1 Tax=Cucurbita pepo subsp. pepo TaxID=3664 RepID=UPI000C9D728B|nr:pentatricopeptide repeat-containing protein DOT4, chloroplastic-like [Cucurbita pepo subsp. pepo]XP_023538702.1 pentatricopeptide repeat-containing protein DOT4, chloroplastic-like [Cucurbita pepo subsp. pepo]XP_023538703.1 pentatricopeptide repeat-containing protein DOT4, chloroplastic-like [Cucurbita pepo subsp. pepo]XP_023538704.1 pentatricopeptide repeat-containing protein DOT4, chloroplastic-like [Cucurbita pepo subsp. pepo]
MLCFSRCARYLFVKSPQRKNYTIGLVIDATSAKKQAYYEDPVGFFAQQEDVISWTSKITNLVRTGQPDSAFGFFKMMFANGHRPNYVTMLSVLRAIDALSWESTIEVMHGGVIKMGFESEVAVSTALLGFYSMRDIGIVWKLFYQIPYKDVVLWSAVISACVKHGQFIEAFHLFREMQYQGVHPNHVSIVSILPACADFGALSLGKEIHAFSMRRDFYSIVNIQNSLMDMYSKCRNLEASIRVLKTMRKKDMVSWRTVTHACIQNNCPSKAFKIFTRMRSFGFELGETMMLDFIAAVLLVDELLLGLAVHCHALKGGFLCFISVGTELLQMYAKFGELGLAKLTFDELVDKDIIAWSAMISAYSHGEEPLSAIQTFKMMQSTNERPNAITFVSLVNACSSLDAQELGESIHAHITKSGYSSNTCLMSALVDFYCILRRVKLGEHVFDEIVTKDLVCWSTMIKGYGTNGCGNEALNTFSDMLSYGLKPNGTLFVSLLSACAQCGLEKEGWMWFNAMIDEYNITPTVAHYACMVELLARQGKIREAVEFVKKMAVEPDTRIWGALFAGCKLTHGFSDIADSIVQQLNALEPNNSDFHAMLHNFCIE